jgi:putative membrane protein
MPQSTPPEPLESSSASTQTNQAADTDTLRRREEIATHLANERTFVAWSFTGILIIGSGVALARTLIALNTSPLSASRSGRVPALFYPTTLGLLFLAAGLAVIIMAACRYLSVQEQITRQRYRPSNSTVLVFLAIVLGLCVVLAGFLLQLRGTL